MSNGVNLKRQSPACLSDREIDCLVAGPKPGETFPERWGQHLGACPGCTIRLQEHRAQAAAFADKFDLRSLAQRTIARREALHQRKRSFLWVGLPAIAATAGILISLLFVLPRTKNGEGFRTKGKASFGFYVKRGEREFLGESEMRTLAGDRLRFFTQTDEPAFFAVLDVEASGAVMSFVPSTGGQAVAVPVSREHRLAESTELDASQGEERLVGVLCPAAFSIDGPLEKLRGWDGKPDSLQGLLDPVLPRGCALSVIILDKGTGKQP